VCLVKDDREIAGVERPTISVTNVQIVGTDRYRSRPSGFSSATLRIFLNCIRPKGFGQRTDCQDNLEVHVVSTFPMVPCVNRAEIFALAIDEYSIHHGVCSCTERHCENFDSDK
jgi:hypothetical protein